MVELVEHGEMGAAILGKLEREGRAHAAGGAGDENALVGVEIPLADGVEGRFGPPEGVRYHRPAAAPPRFATRLDSSVHPEAPTRHQHGIARMCLRNHGSRRGQRVHCCTSADWVL